MLYVQSDYTVSNPQLNSWSYLRHDNPSSSCWRSSERRAQPRKLTDARYCSNILKVWLLLVLGNLCYLCNLCDGRRCLCTFSLKPFEQLEQNILGYFAPTPLQICKLRQSKGGIQLVCLRIKRSSYHPFFRLKLRSHQGIGLLYARRKFGLGRLFTDSSC